MAKKQTPAPSNGVDEYGGDAPAGWEDEGEQQIEGWFKPRKGLVIMGRIEGLKSIPRGDDGPQDHVLIRLERPTLAIPSEPERDGEGNAIPIRFDKGQIVALGLRQKLEVLRLYVMHKGQCWVRCDEKINLKNGRSLWNFSVKCHGKKYQPPAAPPQTPASQNDSFGDDVPF